MQARGTFLSVAIAFLLSLRHCHTDATIDVVGVVSQAIIPTSETRILACAFSLQRGRIGAVKEW